MGKLPIPMLLAKVKGPVVATMKDARLETQIRDRAAWVSVHALIEKVMFYATKSKADLWR